MTTGRNDTKVRHVLEQARATSQLALHLASNVHFHATKYAIVSRSLTLTEAFDAGFGGPELVSYKGRYWTQEIRMLPVLGGQSRAAYYLQDGSTFIRVSREMGE